VTNKARIVGWVRSTWQVQLIVRKDSQTENNIRMNALNLPIRLFSFSEESLPVISWLVRR
jgi:hypothetical protein